VVQRRRSASAPPMGQRPAVDGSEANCGRLVRWNPCLQIDPHTYQSHCQRPERDTARARTTHTHSAAGTAGWPEMPSTGEGLVALRRLRSAQRDGRERERRERGSARWDGRPRRVVLDRCNRPGCAVNRRPPGAAQRGSDGGGTQLSRLVFSSASSSSSSSLLLLLSSLSSTSARPLLQISGRRIGARQQLTRLPRYLPSPLVWEGAGTGVGFKRVSVEVWGRLARGD